MKKKPIEPEMQDAVIYTRYSSHNQRDCSIEQQVADCEIFARQNNLRVVKVYADRHLSGTTDNRPQFQQMLKDASHGHWAYVICWKIDRFARNRYDSATYKFRLKKAGVRVLYAKESIPDGPEGILLESVLEGSAEYYSAALAQNIRRGMKFNAEQCKVNSGSIPFGYCKGPDGRFAIHEANAEVVREIFRKAAAGMPFVDIANDLNSRGLKTSRGGRWNKGSFRLLMNEAYIGVYHFSDTRIEGGMPALIDQGTFWAANERLKANSSVRGRHQDGGDYLLTGKLKCAHCGSYMIGFSGTGKSGELHYYYGCQKRRRERACKKANVPREWIERVVVKAALDYVLRPEVMEWIADAVMEYQEREAASAQLAALTAELEENRKATDNVMKAIEAGIITSTTKQRLLDLEAKAQDLKRAIELEKLSHVRLERDQILFWLDRFRGGSLQSQEFRRKVIDAFVSVVYLFDDHLRIAFNYSGGSNAEADFDLVMDAEAAAGELSKKFAQGHVASMIYKKRKPPCSTAWRLFFFVLQKNTGRARIRRPCRYCIIRSQICYRIRKRLAGAMVRQRSSARCGMAQIHDHQDLFVFGQAQLFCQLLRIKKVDPAAVHACIGSGQDHVGGHDGGILHTGVPPAAGVGEHIGTVKRHHQTGGCIVAAGRCLVDLCKPLCRLDHIDLLLLKILGSRCHAACFQDLCQLCGVHRLACIKIFAGIPVPDYFCKFHARVPSCLFGFLRSL